MPCMLRPCPGTPHRASGARSTCTGRSRPPVSRDVAPDPGDSMSTVAPSETPPRATTSHARELNRWWVVKLAVMALLNAGLLYAAYSALMVQEWAILGFTAVLLVVVNWVYVSRRMVPAKYLLPGIVFLLVYQVFTMGYTAYIAFTNYRSEEHTSELQSRENLVCRLLLEKKKDEARTYNTS